MEEIVYVDGAGEAACCNYNLADSVDLTRVVQRMETDAEITGRRTSRSLLNQNAIADVRVGTQEHSTTAPGCVVGIEQVDARVCWIHTALVAVGCPGNRQRANTVRR